MNKEKFIDRIQKGQTFVESAFAALTDAERNQAGTLEHWSAKDTLAHISAWQLRWVNWLAPLGEGKPFAEEGPELAKDEIQENARIFAQNQARPWGLIHADYQTASRGILRLAPLLSEEDLFTPHRFAWLEDQTVASRMSGTFYWHVQAHISQFFVDRKEPERAVQIAEEFASQVGGDESAEDRGTALYNLACYYALAGKSERALPNLKIALSLYPNLIDWSKKDTDLDSLRALAEFQSLFQG